MSNQENQPRSVTARVSTDDPAFESERPIEGFNVALQRAVDDYTKGFPPGTTHTVRVEFRARVKRTNPGAYDEYIVTLEAVPG